VDESERHEGRIAGIDLDMLDAGQQEHRPH
jgi:hypothetical protein